MFDADEGAVRWNGRVDPVPVHRPSLMQLESVHYACVGQVRFLRGPCRVPKSLAH